MLVFEDAGFDLLPKIPAPGNTPATFPQIEAPPIAPTVVSPIAVATPGPIPPKKGGNTLEWFLFSLLMLGSIGAVIYMAKRDSSYKKALKVRGS